MTSPLRHLPHHQPIRPANFPPSVKAWAEAGVLKRDGGWWLSSASLGPNTSIVRLWCTPPGDRRC